MSKSIQRWIKLMEFGKRMGCHQMPERSFFFKGYQFPICARCTGVFIGELIAIILLLCSIKINFIVSVALLLLMGMDWGLQFIKILESNNIRRLITGISGGFGLTYIYYHVIMFFVRLI